MKTQKSRVNKSEKLKKKKIILLFLICCLTITTSTSFDQNNSTSSNLEQLNSLKKSLKKVSISYLGATVSASEGIKAYTFDGELQNKEVLKSKISYWVMDPEFTNLKSQIIQDSLSTEFIYVTYDRLMD